MQLTREQLFADEARWEYQFRQRVAQLEREAIAGSDKRWHEYDEMLKRVFKRGRS